VTTIMQPGIYDLYQENDDMSVPADRPVILQVPVQVGRTLDYLYLTTLNRAVFDRYVTYPYAAMSTYQTEGVILSAGTGSSGDDPFFFRLGASKVATNLTYYSYRNRRTDSSGTTFNAIPVGASVKLVEAVDPVEIKVLSKSAGRVRVQVSYGPPPGVVSVAGQVQTPAGAGLRSATVRFMADGQAARVVTTSSFGYYSFEEVPAGVPVQITVQSRRYRFTPVERTFSSNVSDLNFVGLE
jgi:hypothetical protein